MIGKGSKVTDGSRVFIAVRRQTRAISTDHYCERGSIEDCRRGVVADVYQGRSFLPEWIREMSPGERWCRHRLRGGKEHRFIGNQWCREKVSCSSGLKPTLRLIFHSVGFSPLCAGELRNASRMK